MVEVPVPALGDSRELLVDAGVDDVTAWSRELESWLTGLSRIVSVPLLLHSFD